MPNGSGFEGPARADRYREMGAKHDRVLQKAMDEARSKLQSITDEDEHSEVTVDLRGMKANAKGLPAWAIVFLAVLGALVVAFLGWLRLR